MNKTETAKLQKYLTAYLKEIHETYVRRDFREESFYPYLKDLFENCAHFFITEEEAKALVLPKRTEVGIPDFLIRKDGEIVGHIEAKVPDSNLREIEKTEQIRRYRDALPNLILTNFVEFRRYRNGAFIEQVDLCSPAALQGLKPPVPENEDAFFDFIEKFCDFATPEIRSASELAVVLAKKTRLSKTILEEVLEQEKEPDYPFPLIKGFYETFRDTLIEELTEERFVDLYAQTITYGLFTAKMMAREQDVDEDSAWRFIPNNVPLLRNIFHSFSGPSTPEPLSWVIDDIVRVLNKMDIATVRSEVWTSHKMIDPIIHFYETFLATYNPEERERMGVYYTPLPVVSYIVRSINDM